MNIRIYAVVSAVMYFVAVISVLCLLGTDFVLIGLTHTQKFITAFLVFFFSLLGTYIRCIGAADWYCRKILRQTVILLFFVYILIVVDFTLLDDGFGRNLSNIFSISREEFSNHISENVNFVPFATVKLFLEGHGSGDIATGALFENIIGNLCVFMPFAIFIPIIFRRLDNLLGIFLSTALTVALIEFLQLVFLTGAMDIDDLILNTLGALLVYMVAKTKTVSRILARLTYGVWSDNE